jgi:hypothetical protein
MLYYTLPPGKISISFTTIYPGSTSNSNIATDEKMG